MFREHVPGTVPGDVTDVTIGGGPQTGHRVALTVRRPSASGHIKTAAPDHRLYVLSWTPFARTVRVQTLRPAATTDWEIEDIT